MPDQVYPELVELVISANIGYAYQRDAVIADLKAGIIVDALYGALLDFIQRHPAYSDIHDMRKIERLATEKLLAVLRDPAFTVVPSIGEIDSVSSSDRGDSLDICTHTDAGTTIARGDQVKVRLTLGETRPTLLEEAITLVASWLRDDRESPRAAVFAGLTDTWRRRGRTPWGLTYFRQNIWPDARERAGLPRTAESGRRRAGPPTTARSRRR